jgi:cellulose synthase/poly-beta-1,6-N-acetylglucosamine synthase-like glycosyltransferase
MRITVVVPSYRRPAELARCLAGLAMQDRPPDEVLVVARIGDDETLGLFEAAAPGAALRCVTVDEEGVVSSLNAGLAGARGDIVAITDDDAVPRADWLQRIESMLAADDGVGAVGGRDWVRLDGDLLDGEKPVVGRVRWFGRVVGNHHLGAGPAREVQLLKGANMAVRRAALDGITIDMGLRGNGAQPHWEIDLCLRLRRAGWRLVYDPAVAVDHLPAERHDEDQRNGRPLTALENEVYNETRALLRGLSWWHKPIHLTYGLLVGARSTPGVVTGVVQGMTGRREPGAYAAATRARVQAAAGLIGGGESERDAD